MNSDYNQDTKTVCIAKQNLETGFNGRFGYSPERTSIDKYGYENTEPQMLKLSSSDSKSTGTYKWDIRPMSYTQKVYENGQL